MSLIHFALWVLFFTFGAVGAAETPVNEVPMFGGEVEPASERMPEQSRNAAAQGWKAFYSGDFSKAIRRFNQAWTLDAENPEAYWGFGLVARKRAEQGETEQRLNESIRFLKMAVGKAPDDGQILGDLAFSHLLLGQHLEAKGADGAKAFDEAGKLFPKANQLAPTEAPVLANWSIYFFYRKDYPAAQEKASMAEANGFTFRADYLKALAEKREPSGAKK